MFALGNWVKSGLGTSGFEDVDKLWKSIQKNMASYISKQKGGNAAVVTPVIVRPQWSDVQDYLLGKITFAQLKKKMGC
jgi:hypothetical protein